MKLGLFITTYNNPLFLRATLSQLMLQQELPEEIVLHQSAGCSDYRWAVQEALSVYTLAVDVSKFVHYVYSPFANEAPQFQSIPLRRLLDHGCDHFVKWDDDDIYYDNHLYTLRVGIEENDCDVFINTRADVLEALPGTPPRHYDAGEWIWNPTGGPSNNIIYNQKFAEDYLHCMEHEMFRGVPDDVIMGNLLNSGKYKVVRKAIEPVTMCYVAHGANTSGFIGDNEIYNKQKKLIS